MVGYEELKSITNVCWLTVKNTLADGIMSDEEWEKLIKSTDVEVKKYRYGVCGMGISKVYNATLFLFECRENALRNGETLYPLDEQKKELFTVYQYGWKIVHEYGTKETLLTEEEKQSLMELNKEIPKINPVYAPFVKELVEACLQIVFEKQAELKKAS